MLKCCLLLSFTTTTISRSDCDTWWKVGFIQLAKTSSAVGLIRSSKALPKARVVLKKDHGHWLVVCCPSDPLQLSESWRNYYLWAVCSADQWDAPKTAAPAAGIRRQNGPVPLHHSAWLHVALPTLLKLNKLGCEVLLHLHIHLTCRQPTATSSGVSTTFYRQKGRKCFPRVCWIPKHRFLPYRSKQTYFLLAKMCWL